MSSDPETSEMEKKAKLTPEQLARRRQSKMKEAVRQRSLALESSLGALLAAKDQMGEATWKECCSNLGLLAGKDAWGRNPALEAAAVGSDELLGAALALGYPADEAGLDGKGALELAAESGCVDGVKRLLSIGVKPRELEDRSVALELAFAAKAWAIFEAIAAEMKDQAKHRFANLISIAAARGDQEMFQKALPWAAPSRCFLGATGKSSLAVSRHAGASPMGIAAMEGRVEWIEALAAEKMDIEEPDALGYRALDRACVANQLEAARKLLDLGASLESAWHDRVSGQRIPASEVRSKGASRHAQELETPLFLAASAQAWGIADLLAQLGANPWDACLTRGLRMSRAPGAVQWAAQKSTAGQPNELDALGKSPLARSAMACDPELTEALIGAGADPRVIEPWGGSARQAYEERAAWMKNPSNAIWSKPAQECLRLIEACCEQWDQKQAKSLKQ